MSIFILNIISIFSINANNIAEQTLQIEGIVHSTGTNKETTIPALPSVTGEILAPETDTYTLLSFAVPDITQTNIHHIIFQIPLATPNKYVDSYLWTETQSQPKMVTLEQIDTDLWTFQQQDWQSIQDML